MHKRSKKKIKKNIPEVLYVYIKVVHLDVVNERRRKKKKGRPCCSATPSSFLPLIAASQVTAHRFLRRQRSLSATDSLSCV